MSGTQRIFLTRWGRRNPPKQTREQAHTQMRQSVSANRSSQAWQVSADGVTLAGLALSVALAPTLTIIGHMRGLPLLLAVIPLLCALALTSLLLCAEARRLVRLDLFAAAVGAYALVSAGATVATVAMTLRSADVWQDAAQLGVRLGLALAPVVSYFGALSLCASPEKLGWALRWLTWALLGAAVPLAGGVLLPLLSDSGSYAPGSVGLPDLATLANLLGITIVVASVGDAPNAALRWWLGAEQTRSIWRRAWFWGGRIMLAGAAVAGGLALLCGLIGAWSRTALLATALALLGVSLARRRYGRFSLFAGATALALCVIPRGASGWPGEPFVVLRASISPAQTPVYLASLALIGLAMARCWLTYRRLRPTGEAAGVTLAALGCAIYLFIAGLTSTPLAEPAATLACWPLFGVAVGVTNALERQRSQSDSEAHGLSAAFRDFPLRVAFVVERAAAHDETLAALDESMRVFHPRRVIAIPLAYRSVVRQASGRRGFFAQVARIKDHSAAWLSLLRATLAARPDLLVASNPTTYLPTLFVGHALGVPAQWHAREVASPRLQLALDAFAPLTAGIVANSQYVARSFQIEALGRRLRVVRPGVAAPPTLMPEQRAKVRASLGADESDTLAIVPVPIGAESGHFDLLQALLLARDHFPHLRVALASERAAGKPKHDATLARLRVAITLNGLDDVVRLEPPCANLAEVVGSSDLAIFPQWSAPLSRGVGMALAHGLPIVATRGGALVEQLADAWGCVFAAPRDPAGLAQAMTDALKQLSALSRDAQHNKATSHDWRRAEIEAARLQMLYRAICLPNGPVSAPHGKQVGAIPGGESDGERMPILAARSRAWANTLWVVASEPYRRPVGPEYASAYTSLSETLPRDTGDARDSLGDQPVGIVQYRRTVAGEAHLDIQRA